MPSNVTDYGPVGTSDDTATIQAALDQAPPDSQLFFPVGTYTITRPLNVTRRLRITGESTRGTVIRCSATAWQGAQMVRNWTDSDWSAGNNGWRPNTTASPQYYPQFESLRFNTNDAPGVTCLAWVHMQETAYLRDLAFRAPTGSCIAVGLYSNSDAEGSHNGGHIQGVTCYGPGWKHELKLDASGSDLHVSDWTTSPTLHTDSPFWVRCIDVTMDNIHAEAWLDASSPATAAVFESYAIGFVLRDSFYSMHADMPRPLLAARNPNGAGFNYSAPVIDSVRFYNPGSNHSFTGPLIDDSTQPNNTRLIGGIPKPVHVYSYDGTKLTYADTSNGRLKSRAYVSCS